MSTDTVIDSGIKSCQHGFQIKTESFRRIPKREKEAFHPILAGFQATARLFF
jgi:hypothetical protein